MNIWWTVMVIIGAVNWLAALYILCKSFGWKKAEPQNAKYISLLQACGIVFASVALYRSAFVSSYPDRLAWFDVIFNSPFIVRSLAFFAELSFIGIIAAVLLRVLKDLDITNTMAIKTPLVAVGLIFIAQFFAYVGLVNQSQLLFFIEEFLWAAAFLIIFPLVIIGLRKIKTIDIGKSGKAFLIIMCVWCTGYLLFQLGFALPFMYFPLIAQDAGRIVPPDALHQSIFNYRATRDFNEWGGIGFFIWHSGYFSVCVWMTLFFMTAPRKKG